MENLNFIDINEQTNLIKEAYKNFPVAYVNDHIVRVSVMTEDFYWHYHPNSDETFLVMEGELFLDLEGKTIELKQGQLFTVLKNTPHRTRPKTARMVNITFEYKDIETVKLY